MRTAKLILLNGTTASGKTSISMLLPGILGEPYLTLSIDQFLSIIPEQIWQEWLWRPTDSNTSGLVKGTAASPRVNQAVNQVVNEVIADMHHTIVDLTNAGHAVIVEHMLLDPQWVHSLAASLGQAPALLVGVRCPVAVAEQRAAQWGEAYAQQVQAQFERVHAHGIYDLEVDTSLLSPDACAMQIQRRLTAEPPPMALTWLRAWNTPDKHRGWLRVRQEKRDAILQADIQRAAVAAPLSIGAGQNTM